MVRSKHLLPKLCEDSPKHLAEKGQQQKPLPQHLQGDPRVVFDGGGGTIELLISKDLRMTRMQMVMTVAKIHLLRMTNLQKSSQKEVGGGEEFGFRSPPVELPMQMEGVMKMIWNQTGMPWVHLQDLSATQKYLDGAKAACEVILDMAV